jgi:hypothetical protein
MYVGSWKIDDLLTFVVNTQVFATGVATDADSVPTYRVYEDETTTPILTGSMALLDSANTAGFYSEQITLSAANGFEKGKCYSIYIAATVSSVAGATHRTFQIQAEVDTVSLAGQAVTAAAGVTFPSSVASPTNITAGTITSVGSVTSRVTANTDQLNGQAVTAAAGVTFPSSVASPTNITAGTITNVGTVTSVTNRVTANTDELAGQTVTAAAGVTFPSSVASPTNITAGTITNVGTVTTVATVTNLTNAPTNGDLTAAMKASVTAAVPAAAQNATELLDQAAGVEANLTVRQQLRLAAAALYGKAAGLSTTTVTFRDTNDTVDRITATVDASGDRTVVTLNST